MKNIFLRSIQQDDLLDVHMLYSDLEICLCCGVPPSNSINTAEKYIETMLKNQDSFAIINQSDNAFVGVISIRKDIHRFNPNAYMIGYRIKKHYWGQDIATAAVKRIIRYGFEHLGADLITACHFTDNIRSARVLEKSGFTKEGILRKEYARFDGQILDSCSYSLLYDEYIK